MKYCVLPSWTWTYPDINEYDNSSTKAELLALRNGYASFQIHLSETCGSSISVSFEGLEAELYREIPVRIESCPGIEHPMPHFPERKAPFFVNDCLKAFECETEAGEPSTTLYIAVRIPNDAPDTICGETIIKDCETQVNVPVKILVSKATLPPERLNMVMGWSPSEAIKRHKVSSREDFLTLETNYMKAMRRQHQTLLYVRPPRERFINGKWEFDFTEFNRYVSKGLQLGFRAFNIEGIGFRLAWDKPYIYHFKTDLLSWEGYNYLEQFLAALKNNLREMGWLDRQMFNLGVCDEPNDINAMSFRALVSMIRKLFPEIKLFDATSGAPIYGTLDVWVPRSDEYEKHREMFDHYRKSGDEVWHYVCLFPREDGYINRFMDIPLLATRYLFWGNYKYDLTGYLHWTINDYQSEEDPFETSCPRHVNAGSASILPPGDDKLVYPSSTLEPLISMRLENHRESAEEYAMLSIVAEHDKALADEICDSVFRSFNSVEFDGEKFRAARTKLIEAYEKYSN